jgi:predicted nuclease of predicted toxin-antitoxin system
MREAFDAEVVPVRDVGLRDATDRQIFDAARQASTVVMTKDGDFVRLLERLGPPPQILWLTCGNTSNARLKELLLRVWPRVRALLEAGEPLVEISDVI